MRRFLLIVIASAAGLAAEPASAKSSVYVSLMGEPFRTNDAGQDPFDQWFELADLDGNGAISRLEFRQDAEAFFVLPDERMYLISKGRRGPITLFAFPPASADSLVTLQALQQLTSGLVQLPEMVTAAGATPDGRVIVIRSYSALQLYGFDGARLTPLLDATGLDLQPLREFQGEGVDINAQGTVYLVSEKGLEARRPPLSKVHCKLSKP